VCHEDFVAGCEVVQLPCRHCFHEHCLTPWLQQVRGAGGGGGGGGGGAATLQALLPPTSGSRC
jgi:hypothetical protein